MTYTKVPKVIPGEEWSAADNNLYLKDNLDAIAANALLPAMRKIRELVLTSDLPVITLGAIPQNYLHLQVVLRGRIRIPGATGGVVIFRFNGDAGTNYYNETVTATGSGAGIGVSQNIAAAQTGVATIPSDNAVENYAGMSTILIYGYSSSQFGKVANIEYGYKENLSGSNVRRRSFYWDSLDPITRITISVDTYTDLRFLAGTVISMYGLL